MIRGPLALMAYNDTMKRGIVWTVLLSLLGVGGLWSGLSSVQAATFNSSNFSINGNLGDSAAGGQNSTNYQLTSASGGSIAGNASSGSYKLGQGYIPTLENSMQVVAQSNGLLAYYAFDEPGGVIAYDDSANLYNGTFVGTPGRVAGKLNGALEFTGATNYVEAGTYSVGGSAMTVSAWMLGSSLSGEARIASKASGQAESDHDWMLGLGSGAGAEDKLRIRLKTAGVTSTFSTGDLALADSTWYHVAFTYDGSNVRVYLNGSEVGSFAKTGTLDQSGLPVRIGSGNDGSGGASAVWDGLIDEVKVFNRSLSQAELAAEYSANNAGASAGLTLGAVTAGTSRTSNFDVITQTSAGGYTLAISQNANLTNGGASIPGISGSIASPVSWNEGTTKGLGFTLYGTNATALPGIWSSGAAYAALPGSATGFYTRTNYTGGTKDILNMRLRLDTATSQLSGDYSNSMTITGTMVP